MYIGVNQTSGVAGEAVSDQFPAGLRVLAVDNNATCLRILEHMLKRCHYQVTKCSSAEAALNLLRDNKDGFDVVMSEVHMAEMDGFKLLEQIGSEMDLPVIMVSSDERTRVVMECVTRGACDYFVKPVRMEALRSIWQHVVRKRKHKFMQKDDQSPSDIPSSIPQLVWTADLHHKFVDAVNQLVIEKVELDKILELMNVPGITIETVAGHLQKYRLSLKTQNNDWASTTGE